ncbi:unnamed protein product, partial [Polarella glacialis]
MGSAASVEVLSSRPWQMLHRLLGDEWFQRLLVRHLLLLDLPPSGRWLQLTGHPQEDVEVPGTAHRSSGPGLRTGIPDGALHGPRRQTWPDRRSVPVASGARCASGVNGGSGVGGSLAQPVVDFRPSSVLVPREQIFFTLHFSDRAGLPVKHPLKALPADSDGARRLASWLMGPGLMEPRPPAASASCEAFTLSPTSRKRRKRRRRGQDPVQEETPLLRSRPSPKARPEAALPRRARATERLLVEPLRKMLEATQQLDFQQLLVRHCPSDTAIATIQAFEHRNPYMPPEDFISGHDGHRGVLPVLLGRRCRCGAAQTCASRCLDLPRESVCTGGAAELHFMQRFPAMSCAVPASRVADFVSAGLHGVVGGAEAGAELLGSRRNWQRFLQTTRSWVYQRRGETLSAHDAVQGLSARAFRSSLQRRAAWHGAAPGAEPSAASEKSGARTASGGKLRVPNGKALQEILARLCHFLLAHVAVPLLRSHFYITDAEPTGTRAIFFRKNVWHLLRSRADCGYLHLCLKSQSGRSKQPEGGEAVASATSRKAPGANTRSAGSARRSRRPRDGRRVPTVRWLPKKLGFRPIVNVSRTLGIAGQRLQRQTLRVLSHLRAAHPEVLGRSLLSQAEVYSHLACKLRELVSTSGAFGRKELFVAVADLSNCYERIRHRPLLQRIEVLPLAAKYRIERLMVRRKTASSENGLQSWERAEVALTDRESLVSLLVSPRCPAALRNGPLLLLPGSQSVGLKRSMAMAVLRDAVSGHRVALGTQRKAVGGSSGFAREGSKVLVRGILQGSRFSSFLCGMHMAGGDVANFEVMPTEQDEGFLLRLVDDFLLVCRGTPDPASRFLSALKCPDNAYGGELNLRKCAANFPLGPVLRDGSRPGRIGKSLRPSEDVVPWAGLTLAPGGGLLNVSCQGQRGACVADALALTRRTDVGRGVGRRGKLPWRSVAETKLRRFLDLKLAPLLVDPSLNSSGCIRANVARVCGLCGL